MPPSLPRSLRAAALVAAVLPTLVASACAIPEGPDAQQSSGIPLIVADPGVQLAIPRVDVKTSPAPEPPAPALPAGQPVPGQARGHDWIQATMARYGIYPPAGTRFAIDAMPAGCEGADGCTRYLYYTDTGAMFDIVITIRPGQLTEYLLFHEIGHARGVRDECGADKFARSVLGPVPGHYC